VTNDYASKEKAFLESLKADTGRDLGQWMQAIKEQDLAHRNDTIDWLRHQGFIFAKASWLERIYHNGGRPIYLSELPPNQPSAPKASRPALRLVASNPGVPPSPQRIDQPKGPAISPVPASGAALKSPAPVSLPIGLKSATREKSKSDADGVKDTIARAKAFAPLARHLLDELLGAVPKISIVVKRNHLEFGAPDVFGALVMSPKGLRLCLDLGERAFSETIVKTRLPSVVIRLPVNLTHMIVLEDARQLDAALLDLIKSANQRLNG